MFIMRQHVDSHYIVFSECLNDLYYSMERPQPFIAATMKNCGEVGKLIYTYNWAATPLGPLDNWPTALRFSLNTLLHANIPMVLFWGEHAYCFYNEAFRLILPDGLEQTLRLGQRGAESWQDAWDKIQPAINQVLREGASSSNTLIPVQFRGHGNTSEVCRMGHFSPVHGENGIPAGVLVICAAMPAGDNQPGQPINGEQHFRAIMEQATNPIFILKGEDMKLEIANEAIFNIWKVGKEAIGKPFREILPEMEQQGFLDMLKDVYHHNRTITGKELPAVFNRADGSTEKLYFNFVYQPYKDIDGTTSGVLVIAHNVTEQVVGRRRMEESEQRFRALVMATSDVVYRMSPDWTEMRNLRGRGFLSDTEGPIRNWLEKYIHPKDKQRVQDMIDQAVATKSIFELEHQIRKIDGALGWTFSRAIPIMDENGNIIEWFGTASDITQRKAFEEQVKATQDQLSASQRLYDAITGSTPDLIYVFDLNYNFIYANKALLTMWGRTWEESAGKKLLDIGYEPWHAEMHEREIDQVIATKKLIRGEVAFPHAVMGNRIYDYIFAPVLNNEGDVEAIAGTTRDISDLKVAEQALSQSEEQFRTLTQSLPQLVLTADESGACNFFNQQWYDYTGSHPEDTAGDGWMTYIHPSHRTQLSDRWKLSLTSGAPLAFEFQLKARNDCYQWFYIVGNPIKDEQGNILKWVAALTNIEEQKAVEERLEQLVNERTRELTRSNDDLQQFAHVASHDLKEPVRKIKTFIDRLEHDTGSQLSAKGKNFLAKINTATDRMYAMIEGVLNYSSVDTAGQVFSLVDLNEVFSSIELDLEIPMHLKQAKLVHDRLPIVKGSPVLIYQLFYNLINNSLKFTAEGTLPLITITAARAFHEQQEYIQIDVKDNGIGFDQTQAQHIFNSFTRLNSKDKYEGTGLGLALCKKIVERLHGFITATGFPGEGAVFSMLLPA